MFLVPTRDDRLRNKDEVVVMRLPTASGERQPLAMSTEFLNEQPVYHTEAGGHSLVVVTSRAGANRVYEAGSTRFARRLDDDRVADDAGRIWTVAEDALISQDESAQRLARVPAQRAFWFGWYAQFPDTLLIE